MVPCTFVYAKLCVHKTVMVGDNLHRLIYNLLIAIVFSLHLLLSVNSKKIPVEDVLNTKGLVVLTQYQTSGLKIDQSKKLQLLKIIRDIHSQI